MDKLENIRPGVAESAEGKIELGREEYRAAGETAIDATEETLKEMGALESSIESMERRTFKSAEAEAKDDKAVLKAKAKLNELREKLGLEPVEMVVNRAGRVSEVAVTDESAVETAPVVEAAADEEIVADDGEAAARRERELAAAKAAAARAAAEAGAAAAAEKVEVPEAARQEMDLLEAQIASMERRHFTDPVAEAKDDERVLAEKAKLNELRGQFGLEPVEMVVNREQRIESAEASEDGEALGAASGELDMLNPNRMTTEALTVAALVHLQQEMRRNRNVAQRVQEMMAGARAEQPTVTETSGQETVIVEVPEQTESLEKAERAGRVYESLKGRRNLSARRFMNGAKRVLAGVLVALSLSACADKGVVSAAVESGEIPEDEAEKLAEEGESEADEFLENFDMDDYTKDTRFEHVNGFRYDYVEGGYLRTDEKKGPENFGVDLSEFYGDREGLTEKLMMTWRNEAEPLAAVASFYPSALQTAGLTGKETATDLDELFSNGADGGKFQDPVTDQLEAILKDQEHTKFVFYREYKAEESYYMHNSASSEGETNPSTVTLGKSLTARNGEAQVMIIHEVVDENGKVTAREIVDLNLPCGGQPNVAVKPIPEKAKETTETVIVIEDEPVGPGVQPTDNTEKGPGTNNTDTGTPPKVDNPNQTTGEKPPESNPPITGEKPPATATTPKNAQNESYVVENGGQMGQVKPTGGETTTVETGTDVVPVITTEQSGKMTESSVEYVDPAVQAELEAAARAKAEAEAAAQAAKDQAEREAAARAAAAAEAARKAAEEEAARKAAEAAAAQANANVAASAAPEATYDDYIKYMQERFGS